jgi:beta-glucanase (GH16 family)
MGTAASNSAYFHAWSPPVYIELSMAFDPDTGNWPALFMAPVAINQFGPPWPMNGLPYGELDIFEWQSNDPTHGYGTVHVWENNVDIANNGGSNTWALPNGTNLANFNTYGVLWTPTQICWYLNNVLMGCVSTTSAPYNAVFAGQQAMFLVLLEQAGCNWNVGVCPGQVSPLNMHVQWVHVFQAPSP